MPRRVGRSSRRTVGGESALPMPSKIWPFIAAQARDGRRWIRRNPRTALWSAGASVAVVLLVLLITHWNPYKAQHESFAPIFTLAAGLAVASVTLMRHFAQTDADQPEPSERWPHLCVPSVGA
jgi:hypothetical protein